MEEDLKIVFYYENAAKELSERVAEELRRLGYGVSPARWSDAKESQDYRLPIITRGPNAIFHEPERVEDALRIQMALLKLDPPCYVKLEAGGPRYSPYFDGYRLGPREMHILLVGEVFPLAYWRDFDLSPSVERIMNEATSLARGPQPQLVTTGDLLMGMIAIGDRAEDVGTARFLRDAVVRTQGTSFEAVRDDFVKWKQATSAYGELSKVAGGTESQEADLMSAETAGSLVRARRFSSQTGDAGRIHARHLLAALLAEQPDEQPNDALRWLSQREPDGATLRKHFFAYLPQLDVSQEGWAEILLGQVPDQQQPPDDVQDRADLPGQVPDQRQPLDDTKGLADLPPSTELFERNGTYVSIAFDVRPWDLPVTGFVLPVGTRGGMAGNLAQALKRKLPDGNWKQFDDDVKSLTKEGITFDAPEALSLSPTQSEAIMPRADVTGDEEPYVIIATAAGAETVYDLRRAAVAIVRSASANDIRRLAMSLLGTGRGPFKNESAAVAQEMVHGIWVALSGERPTPNPQEIIITTRSDEALQAAQIRANLFTSNLAQRFINDRPEGDDLLDINSEVNALAETLLQRSVDPPLAVGILGGWGSGKSFVMHLMRQEMNRIRALPVYKAWEDEEGEGPLFPYVGHVYQIEFNAWTYTKSDLWASLLQTIFFELNRQLTLEQRLKKLAKNENIDESVRAKLSLRTGGDLWVQLYTLDENERQALLKNEGLVKDVIDTWENEDADSLWTAFEQLRRDEIEKLREAEKGLDRVQGEIDQKRQERMKKARKDALDATWKGLFATEVISWVKPAFRKQLENQFDAEAWADLEAFAKSLETLPPNLQSGWQLLKERPRNLILTVSLALLTLVGAVASARIEDFVASAASSLGALTSFVATLGSLAILIQRSYRHWRDALNQVESRLETQLPANVARLEAQAERELEADKNYRELKGQRDGWRARVEELRERVGIAQEFVSLYDFVNARLQSGYYEARLGLMYQAEKDFQELTRALPKRTDGVHTQDKRDFFPRGPVRVVLYIDDLDRCPPNKVVEVFEAVQLLLRTELFVVVLGLDTRYITRALETEYAGILIHQGEPSGLDYIEKIIQIPYRIRPIQPVALARFLGEQMDYPPAERDTEDERETASATTETVASDAGAVVQPGGDRLAHRETEEDSQDDVHRSAEEPTLKEEPTQKREPIPADQTSPPAPDDGDGQEEDEPKPEPQRAVIHFNERDFEVMSHSCQRVSLTPRSVKRLTNVFKLMKTYWYRNGVLMQQESLQAVTNLLVLAARYPEIMREVFEAMEAQYRIEFDQPAEHSKQFDAFWKEFIANNELLEAHWDKGEFTASTKALNFKRITFADLGWRNFNLVSSFSFVGDLTYTAEPDRQMK